MTKEKFTPGPWYVALDDFIYCKKEKVAKMHIEKGEAFLNDIGEANANLIAAAPEMYYALMLAMDDLDHLKKRPRTLEKIKRALAKAKGEL